MTIGVGHTVMLTDRDRVEVSGRRRLRLVVDILNSLRRHIHGADPRELEDAARNLAVVWGRLGLADDAPKGNER